MAKSTYTITDYLTNIFVGIHVVIFILFVVLSNNTFSSYMKIEKAYNSYILTISNFILISLLAYKHFLPKLKKYNGDFLDFIKKHKMFLGSNISFFLLLIINGDLEGHLLNLLQKTHTNILPVHVIIYFFMIYSLKGQYESILTKYKVMKKNSYRSYFTLSRGLIEITMDSVKELAFICLIILASGKTQLAHYAIHHVCSAFLFVGLTSLLIFLALYLYHKVKK